MTMCGFQSLPEVEDSQLILSLRWKDHAHETKNIHSINCSAAVTQQHLHATFAYSVRWNSLKRSKPSSPTVGLWLEKCVTLCECGSTAHQTQFFIFPPQNHTLSGLPINHYLQFDIVYILLKINSLSQIPTKNIFIDIYFYS